MQVLMNFFLTPPTALLLICPIRPADICIASPHKLSDEPFNKYLNRKFYLHKYFFEEPYCEQQTGHHTNL
jgi:hypothetical protein